MRVDPSTHRLIGDLSHLLGRTRVEILRRAVDAFAASQEPTLERGLGDAAARVALGGTRHHGGPNAGEQASAPSLEGVTRGDGGPVPRIAAARSARGFDRHLTVAERFEFHRDDLVREFARFGARNPRLADPGSVGGSPGDVVIVVDYDDPSRPSVGKLMLPAIELLGCTPYIMNSAALA